MNKLKRFQSMFVILALSLAACQAAGQESTPAVTSAAGTALFTQSSAPTMQSPASTQRGTAATSAPQQTPAAGTKPPQTNAAQLRPPERRAELTRLSNLLQFQVMGLNGAALGKISDFVINTCETYIIYFVVDPAADLKIAAGNRLVIPFEAVSINSGALDAQAKAIVLYLNADQLSRAPSVANPLQLLPNTWEAGARAYWQQVVRVSGLSSECKAGGNAANPVHKIAYATQLLGAELKDGNHNLLGTVTEAILEPESGKLGFYVVNLQGNQGMVMLPLGKTNIPEAALQPGSKIELVLLADNKMLAGAPRIGSVDQATDAQMQSVARGYWGR
jgi:sporulation protein YlmC with PRC-barrel domain